jgi:hypothetical protein
MDEQKGQGLRAGVDLAIDRRTKGRRKEASSGVKREKGTAKYLSHGG